ncbi:MAG: hypothetical protein GF341_05480 [candidate division Zixibacteria bacterium]|nr:hypothetical protein [candidate division Zixibacteria bacterium]
MNKFTYNDFRTLERCPASPKNLQWGISNLVFCSVNTRAKVETCNPETGEYRIVLQGTLDMDNPSFVGGGYGMGY